MPAIRTDASMTPASYVYPRCRAKARLRPHVLKRGWRLMLILALMTLVAAACGSTDTSTSASGVREPGNADTADIIRSVLDRYPPSIEGSFGRTTTAAYEAIDEPKLSDAPYDAEDGRLMTIANTYFPIQDARTLAARARLVVEGRVLAIGRPYFNSDDGAFWHPALHDEPGVTDVSMDLYRDVVVEVADVWGSDLPPSDFEPLLVFTVRGGQAQVVISDGVAEQLEWGSGGRFVIGSPTEVDVHVGEKALFFLNKRPISGLYGGRYAFRFVMSPAHEAAFKFTLSDEKAVNPNAPAMSTSVRELRTIVEEVLGEQAGPVPKEGTFPEPTHPPTSGGTPPTHESESPHEHGVD